MRMINPNAIETLRPRCGNCRHAIASTSAGAGMVACTLYLEFRCADQIGSCGHHAFRCQGAAGDDAQV